MLLSHQALLISQHETLWNNWRDDTKILSRNCCWHVTTCLDNMSFVANFWLTWVTHKSHDEWVAEWHVTSCHVSSTTLLGDVVCCLFLSRVVTRQKRMSTWRHICHVGDMSFYVTCRWCCCRPYCYGDRQQFLLSQDIIWHECAIDYTLCSYILNYQGMSMVSQVDKFLCWVPLHISLVVTNRSNEVSGLYSTFAPNKDMQKTFYPSMKYTKTWIHCWGSIHICWNSYIESVDDCYTHLLRVWHTYLR